MTWGSGMNITTELANLDSRWNALFSGQDRNVSTKFVSTANNIQITCHKTQNDKEPP